MVCTILRLDPALPVNTPRGKARAFLVIDYSEEDHLFFTCAQDETGEIWTYPNPEIRMQPNETFGRRPQDHSKEQRNA